MPPTAAAIPVKTADRAWWSPFGAIDGVHLVHVDLGPDPDRVNAAAAWLDRTETERLRRLRIERRRREFALCRAALRANLCRRLGCANDSLSFGFHEYGKPFALVEGRAAPIGFNVSHSAPHGLIAFASRGRVGVDVEVPRADRDFDAIAGTVFGAEERAVVAAAWGADKMRLFYRIWTLKEAIVKAVGAGSSLDPSGLEIPPDMFEGADSGRFRFPREPAGTGMLACPNDSRFVAAVAYEIDADGR